MKIVGIILLIICLIALGGVIYLFSTSSLTAVYVESIATDPVEQHEYFEELKSKLEQGTFTGTRFVEEALNSPEDYVFYTYVFRIDNKTIIPARVVEIQYTPDSCDVLQLGELSEHQVPAGKSVTFSCTVLTRRNRTIREETAEKGAVVTWYFWGLPFSTRVNWK